MNMYSQMGSDMTTKLQPTILFHSPRKNHDNFTYFSIYHKRLRQKITQLLTGAVGRGKGGVSWHSNLFQLAPFLVLNGYITNLLVITNNVHAQFVEKSLPEAEKQSFCQHNWNPVLWLVGVSYWTSFQVCQLTPVMRLVSISCWSSFQKAFRPANRPQS